ncbi:unnamed protein product [Chondrus crispus]|uniref:Uncharacterized protein n=1 Tax=Chondrus crispus TaxID=2769 RepID=R7QTG8_CHOCR|nr:unnamed protein product [Chondrus crispus]XP_005710964.1 unnamed protein product [Chondrus crispus]CDF40669.1 unnamed protein product [Chondrus crispus]CDF40670.1 unnamed protein product [Chondrus crispus]|eukprot:XP_005710963.1 unnamed protein product [Chondrus crispus]
MRNNKDKAQGNCQLLHVIGCNS